MKRFLSWLISPFRRLPPGVATYSGGARCSVCNKKTFGNHYRINDGDKFYCRQHATERSLRSGAVKSVPKGASVAEVNPWDVKTQNTDKKDVRKVRTTTKFKGRCEYCQAVLQNTTQAFYCKYCKKWHCSKHRLPEEHKCPKPKRPEGMTGSTVVYSAKK